MKPAYFDLTVADLAVACRFFARVLGWRYERFAMPYEYYRIRAGEPREPGIDGGIGAIKDTPLAAGRAMTQVTIPVDDLDRALARVMKNGGRIVEPKSSIPGVGWYATCAEPGGLLFGLVQPDLRNLRTRARKRASRRSSARARPRERAASRAAPSRTNTKPGPGVRASSRPTTRRRTPPASVQRVPRLRARSW
jgi:predicted enzyme related to lactoylglutathione lyase